ncbi:MAG: hypothetical protein JNM10_00275 [Planctomycetia bacterium]|nr:hypothetical protein [Planctomycetia bacterium]
MPAFQIDYDLHAPEKNYDAVISTIKALPGGWCHVLKSTWLVAGNSLTLSGVFAALRAVTDADDSLLVTHFVKPYQGWLPKRVHDWIDLNVG